MNAKIVVAGVAGSVYDQRLSGPRIYQLSEKIFKSVEIHV